MAQDCLDWHTDHLNLRHTGAKELGIPLFLSEFGSCMNTNECVTEINQVADLVD